MSVSINPNIQSYVSNTATNKSVNMQLPKTEAYNDDSIEICSKNKLTDDKKKKRNKLIKIGAGVLVAAGIIATAIFSKGRTLKPANFAENITFKKAENMKEAQEFAQTHFGIKLNLGDDVEVANWALEGLTNINNKFKGKAQMPKNIFFDEQYFAKKGNERTLAYCNWHKDGIGINKKAFDNAMETFEKYIKLGEKYKSDIKQTNGKGSIYEYAMTILDGSQKDGKWYYQTIDILDVDIQKRIIDNIIKLKEKPKEFTRFDALHTNFLIDDLIGSAKKLDETPLASIKEIFENPTCKAFIDKNPDTFKPLADYEKMAKGEQLQECINIMQTLNNNKIKVCASGTIRGNSQFDVLYHEMGHLLHHKNVSLFDEFWGKLSKKATNLFKNDTEKQKIAGKVSWYAQTNQKEYVAECFNAIVSGRTLTDEQMNLYRFYKGPEIEKFINGSKAT